MSRASIDADLSDGELVEIAVSQPQLASEVFDQLVMRYQLAIRNFIAASSGDVELALDLTQETFVHAYQRLDQLSDHDAFESWLYQIARNLWTSHLRRRKRPFSLDQFVEQPERSWELIDPDNEIDRIPEYDLIVNVFRLLNWTSREVLHLRHIKGFSNAEIARVLDITPSAAQKRVRRANMLFHHRYLEAGRTPDHPEMFHSHGLA